MAISLNLDLEYEIANKITIATLKDYIGVMEEQLEDHRNGAYMHEDDVRHSKKQIKRIMKVLKDFEC